jgi:hypothetical protein
VDTYLKFKSSSGGLAFYTAGVFDQAKYAAANSVLNKGLLFNVNGARRSEAPDAGVQGPGVLLGRARRNDEDLASCPAPRTTWCTGCHGARVTNGGELEIVRHKVLTLTSRGLNWASPDSVT